MSHHAKNITKSASVHGEMENKVIDKQPTGVQKMAADQKPPEKADRMRGGCCPCPVRSAFSAPGLKLRRVYVCIGWVVLLLHSHTFLSPTNHRPQGALGRANPTIIMVFARSPMFGVEILPCIVNSFAWESYLSTRLLFCCSCLVFGPSLGF